MCLVFTNRESKFIHMRYVARIVMIETIKNGDSIFQKWTYKGPAYKC